MPPPREFSPRATLISALVVGGLIAWTYIRPAPELISANPDFATDTMGGIPVLVRLAHVQTSASENAQIFAAITNETERVNQHFSTYLPDSEISRINAAPAGTPIDLSPLFLEVYQRAAYWHRETGGAFDPAMAPLLRAYGFGAGAQTNTSPAALTAAREASGLRHFSLNAQNQLVKARADAELDFGGIAKGLAVDRVLNRIRSFSFHNAMVEIGGEVRAMGRTPVHTPWRIAVERPDPNNTTAEFADGVRPINLSNASLAGSGSYRNFRIDASGQPITHIIDPRTGSPATHRVVAVTVHATHCVDADALATALFVLGEKDGLAWVENRPGVEAIFITRDATGFTNHRSSGFAALEAPPAK